MSGSQRGVEAKPPVLVLAVGNRFRRDDGVGAAVLDELRSRVHGPLRDPAAVELLELDGEPTRLLDAWSGRRLAVVVDAARSSVDPSGTVVLVDRLDDLGAWEAGLSSHSGGIAEAVRLGGVLQRMPARLVVVGVVVADLGDGPGLSDAVGDAVGGAADLVERTVRQGSARSQEGGDRVPL